MLYAKNIKSEIQLLNSLRSLVEIYGEIASVRMMKIRGYVLKNREFLNAINDIFQDVLVSYSRKISYLVKKGKLKKGERITFLSHNGKTVAVFISANTGFYGNIVQETFEKFISDVRHDDVEATIVGKLGLSLFLESEPDRPYTYFELPDFGVDESKLAEAIGHLVQYEEIRIYYGKYQSVVTQRPEVSSISAGTLVSGEEPKGKVDYLFEPSIEKILMFFETEIFTSLFDQSLRESQLAKFASRIMAMDEANENIKSKLKETNLEKLRYIHNLANLKQLNSLSPLALMR